MEENRRFSWTDLFIKVILVVIFVLFTVWLLSLGNKDMSNSLDVLTNNIFSENMEKMKNVGKEYFTIERLPKKVGDVKTLTLEEMYDKKLLLELTDKHGNACSAKNSYVSVEKYENEYQMKVFLECGEESEHIIVIMGCYNYCDTDICEFDKDKITEEVEYQYKKTTGGKWSDWGKWSEWSKVSVTKENYREVETKKVMEEYTYDKEVTKTLTAEFDIQCSEGYTLSEDKTFCYKVNSNTDTKEATCPEKSDWTLVGLQSNGTCKYSKQVTYAYTVPVEKPKTCYRQELVTSCPTNGFGCTSEWVNIPYQNVNTCGTYTVNETKTGARTDYITENASCPTGYTLSGGSCNKATSSTNNKEISKVCLNGFEPTNDDKGCYKEVTETVQETAQKEVTYYRYRTRQYINGITDYKWSKSIEDKKLLDSGYKLTGKTR